MGLFWSPKFGTLCVAVGPFGWSYHAAPAARLQPKTFHKGDVIIDHDQAAKRLTCFELGSAVGVCQPVFLRMTASFFAFVLCFVEMCVCVFLNLSMSMRRHKMAYASMSFNTRLWYN